MVDSLWFAGRAGLRLKLIGLSQRSALGSHLVPFLYSSREPSELSQWLCSYDDSTINIVVIIIIIIITWSIPYLY